ncbi:hypothetical protein BKD26_27815 [Streptomyces sp. CB03238]|nr:hypothetical protein BKD26_27815 [Streptomyces sp. CB03238]
MVAGPGRDRFAGVLEMGGAGVRSSWRASRRRWMWARDRDVLLVRVVTSDRIEGWAEWAAMSEPRYCAEQTRAAVSVC